MILTLMNNTLFLMILAMIFSCSDFYRTDNIIGIWEGKHKGKNIFFVFNKDSTCTIKFDSTLGKYVIYEGEYEINLSKKPMPLTIKKISQLPHPLHTIVSFISEKSIKITEFSKHWKLRPISFDKDKVIYLEKSN